MSCDCKIGVSIKESKSLEAFAILSTGSCAISLKVIMPPLSLSCCRTMLSLFGGMGHANEREDA